MSGTSHMGELQESSHGQGHDYDAGSPHLRHAALRHGIVERIRALVNGQFERYGRCRVVEVGAGHGTFTDHVAALGAEVTVTEMSRPSLEVLRQRFAHNPGVRLVHDPDGEQLFRDGGEFDLALCVSVLHHIPDYQGFVKRISDLVVPGGAFASFQDPIWYPSRSRANMTADRWAYYAWRIGRGDLVNGVHTRLRRARGTLDESNPSDMVEYHVVRQGVDDRALESMLRERFDSVDRWTYWSTQSPALQALGSRSRLRTTFGLVASDRRS